jgi:hypothetical protein
MSDVAVAAHTTERLAWSGHGLDVVRQAGVAGEARAFGDPCVAWRDPDRVGKGAGGEVERVPEAVEGLRRVLADQTRGVWQLLQTATLRWLERCQPSYCSCITWQLAQAAGSSVRYEAPRA